MAKYFFVILTLMASVASAKPGPDCYVDMEIPGYACILTAEGGGIMRMSFRLTCDGKELFKTQYCFQGEAEHESGLSYYLGMARKQGFKVQKIDEDGKKFILVRE